MGSNPHLTHNRAERIRRSAHYATSSLTLYQTE